MLKSEIDPLKPLVENYRAVAAFQANKTAAAEDPATPATPSPDPTSNLQPRVYLQVVKESDRAYSRQMGKALTDQGVKVMGIERERLSGLRNTEVRYYKKAEPAEAEKIVEVLKRAGDPSATTLYLNLGNSTKVPASL